MCTLKSIVYKFPIIDSGGSTGNDPHFFLPLLNGDHLCYSVQGQPDFMFSLIKDKYIQLNAQFVLPASDESNTIANVSTFLGNLGLLLRFPNTGKMFSAKVTAHNHAIQIGDDHIVVSNKPVVVMVTKDCNITVNIGNELKVDDESAWLNIKTDLGFGMKIRFYKKHLDLMITNSEGLTNKSDGLMGKKSLG